MPDALNAELDDPIVIGDDYDFERTILAVPEGAALVSGWLTIKEELEDPDSAAIIQKQIDTTVQQGVGQILDAGGNSTQTAEVIFQLTHEDTALLSDRILYWYDIQVRTDTEKNKTVERGRFLPVQQVTEVSV